MKPLKEIASGATPSFPVSGQVWNLSLDEIESHFGVIREKKFWLVDELGPSKTCFDSRYVLYSKLRPYLNKVVLPDEDGVCTSELIPILPDANELHRDYLAMYLRSKAFLAFTEKHIHGANLPRLSVKSLWEHEVPLPPLDDQKRIAHLLGKVEGLIAQRKQHLQQLDALLKSVFLEMFGDIQNQKSEYPLTSFRPYLKASSGKSSKGVLADFDTGIPVFGGNGMNGWATRSLCESPVVIAGRVGQQCGVIHVSRGPCWVTDNAIILTIDNPSMLNITYLAEAFQIAPIRERVKQLDLPFINQSMLLDFQLPLPPLAIQNQFAAIVEKVEVIKGRYQKSLDDLEALYGALSQKAFAGELDLSRVQL